MIAPIEDYIMGRTSEEYQRLRTQAKIWEATTHRVLQQAKLCKGMHCLDVGCGPGEVMRLMGETVGPEGQVTGIDMDGNLGNEALDVLRATTDSQFNFLETNVESTTDIPGAPFDLVFARITLVHLNDQIGALRKMARWTKLGGVIVVQEYDFRTWDTYPVHQAATQAIRVFCKVMGKEGRDVHFGSKLITSFVQAGLGAPDGTDVSGFLTGFDLAGPMIQAVYNSVYPTAQRKNLSNETEREEIMSAIAETIQAGTHTVLSPLLISAWKRKQL